MTIEQDLLTFLQASPTPFHAVQQMALRLQAAGFSRLNEGENWQLQAGQGYFVTRNDSSIVAFVYGRDNLLDSGIRLLGAHTDSPCLKVKPQPELQRQGYFQLGVEVYGGVLLNPWFDRDLSLAGRITYRDSQGQLHSALVDFEQAIATIPSLAIHLDREANKNRTVNAQTDILPVLLQVDDDQCTDFRQLLMAQLQRQYPACDVEAVLDYEMSFYDTQPPALVGLQQDFLASARLDNLLSCYAELQALMNAGSAITSMLVCNDHEEVGSASACGAQGPMLKSVLQRLLPEVELRTRVLDKSMMISVDNAHGIHPNYADRHDNNHGPLLNKGPVLKINANQRYATNSETSAIFRWLCEQQQVPVQVFVTRTDMACGSTIGPIAATELGVKTLDVGVATFAMHSIRELAGARDVEALMKVLAAFVCLPSALIESAF